MDQFGKTIMIIGFSVMVLGAIFCLGGKVPGIGKLPGDILIKRGNFTFYFPLATSILLSIILSIILALFRRR
ncbi:MAG: DUF2905 domain-containing protein [Firmicutes bacterium]|nr:DUF2905 domain-containing protein [Bacillota bacterium]